MSKSESTSAAFSFAFCDAELYEEHFATHKFVHLSAFKLAVIATRIFRPYVRFFFQIPRHFDVSRVVCSQHVLKGHCESVPVEHLARFRHAGQKNTPLCSLKLSVNAFFK